MKKISEYKDEEALDVLADILEPSCEILADAEVQRLAKNKGTTKIMLVSAAIKNHKTAVMKILARLEDVPYEEYHCTMLTLPIKVLEILSDKELMGFFTTQGQMAIAEHSGSATENITE